MARGHTGNRHATAHRWCSKISTTEIWRCVTHGRYATCAVHENKLRTTDECVFSSDLFVVAVVRWRLKLNKVKIDKACVRFYSVDSENAYCVLNWTLFVAFSYSSIEWIAKCHLLFTKHNRFGHTAFVLLIRPTERSKYCFRRVSTRTIEDRSTTNEM